MYRPLAGHHSVDYDIQRWLQLFRCWDAVNAINHNFQSVQSACKMCTKQRLLHCKMEEMRVKVAQEGKSVDWIKRDFSKSIKALS